MTPTRNENCPELESDGTCRQPLPSCQFQKFDGAPIETYAKCSHALMLPPIPAPGWKEQMERQFICFVIGFMIGASAMFFAVYGFSGFV